VTDSNLRDLERTWKESGSEEDCEAFLAAKVRAEGWPIRRVLELAMASLIDRKPTPAEVVLWIETDCLPCSTAGCPRAASPELTYQATEDRLCGECECDRNRAYEEDVRVAAALQLPRPTPPARWPGPGPIVAPRRAPPGTYGDGDYGPDSFGGSDY
jgi:hypothetical protein